LLHLLHLHLLHLDLHLLHLLHSLHVQVDRSLLRQSALLLPAGMDRAAVLCAVLAARGGGVEPQPEAKAEADAGAGLACRLAVVFCETKRQCREVAERLQARGAAALALHGDLEQKDRDR
jgi:superfamily II DNA/RNA helicase